MALNKKKDMDDTDIGLQFDNFLRNHRYKKDLHPYFTHTEMNTCKGTYYISDGNYNQFISLYKKFISSDFEIGMVERHNGKKVGPVICDFDFRSRKNYRSYTQEHIKSVISIFIEILQDLFHINEDQLQAYVYEKDKPTMDKKDKDVQYKDGFHIYFPYAPLLVEYRYLIYEIVYNKLNVTKILDDIPSIEPLSEVFDPRIIYSNGIMMYGSSKPGRTPYELTHVYNKDFSEVDITLFDFDSKIDTSLLRSYDDEDSLELKSKHKSLINKCIKICNEKKYPTELKRYCGDTNSKYDIELTDEDEDDDQDKDKDEDEEDDDKDDDNNNDNDNDNEDDKNIKNKSKTKSKYEDLLKIKNNSNKCECCKRIINAPPKDLEYITDLVDCLSRSRSNNYDDWIRVGWCLEKIWHGLLPEYIKFSKKSKKYEPGCCEKIWRTANFNSAEFNLPSLIMWAKQDDPNKYSEIFRNRKNELLQKAMSSTHDDIANVLKEMYGDIYVCASIKDNTWYEFRNHRWINTQHAYTLSERISDEVCAEFANNNSDRINGGLRQDHRDNDEAGFLSKKLFTIYNKLKDVHFKESVLKACRNKFYDPKFEEKLDKNTKLIGFNNGVFDLNSLSFRDGVPEDFLTFSTCYDFREYNDNDEKIKEIEDYFSKVQTDPELREWLLRLIATYIDGSTKNQNFIFWPGSGGNGKSTTIDLIKYTFGEYSCPLPVKVLTGPTPDATVATPALSDKKGKRFVPVSEPAYGDILNVATMKLFSGNDEVPARGLYQEMFYFKPQFKMILACNKLPRIKDLDNGCWRRILVLPFKSCFVDKPRSNKPNEFKRDPDLIDGKLESWKSAFMWYLLRRIYPKYLNDENKCKGSGLKVPKIVLDETEKYRTDSDKFFEYLKKHTTKGNIDEDREDIKTLYLLYKEWFKESYNDKPSSQKEFVEYFIQYDYKIINEKYLYGYKLKDMNEDLD
jgi:P4 family phage/plasmid primase-like protien